MVLAVSNLSDTLQVTDVAGELLDGLDLLVEEVPLDEVGHVEVLGLVGNLMKLEERLVDVTLQLQGSVETLNACLPVVLLGCFNALQDNCTPTLVLEFHEFLGMFLFFVSALLEVGSKVGQSHVGPVVVVRLVKKESKKMSTILTDGLPGRGRSTWHRAPC